MPQRAPQIEREPADAPIASHWGSAVVDLDGVNLPALKARFLVDRAPERGTLCEIGCGDGKLLRTIAEHRPGLTLLGCDVRDPGTPPDRYRFARIAEDGRLPYADGSLDAVIVFDVLEHVPDPAATLAEAARILAPGGALLAFIPIEGERLSFYELYRRILGQDTYVVTKEHIQRFTHEALRDLVTDRFELEEVRYAYHPLGQLMDATFFAAARLTFVRDFWWKDNVYYNAKPSSPSLASRVMNGLLQAGNALAWAESTLLARARVGSAGILLRARVRA